MLFGRRYGSVVLELGGAGPEPVEKEGHARSQVSWGLEAEGRARGARETGRAGEKKRGRGDEKGEGVGCHVERDEYRGWGR